MVWLHLLECTTFQSPSLPCCADTLPEQQRSLVEKQGKWRGSKEVEEEWQAKQLQKGANNKRSGKGSVLKRHVSGVGGNGQRSDSLAMSSHLDYGRQARPIDPVCDSSLLCSCGCDEVGNPMHGISPRKCVWEVA